MSELDALIAKYNKESKGDIITVGITSKDIPRIPFSSPRANYLLRGGIPMYRMTEFAGLESSGKSLTALDIVANYQKLTDSKRVIWVDLEHTFDDVWATLNKVDTLKVYKYKPEHESAEQIFDKITEMVKTDEVGLVIIDSLATMTPESILNEDQLDKQERGGIAKALTRFAKIMVGLLVKHKCTLIGINQLRDDMDNPYNLYVTPGGKAWKFFCSVRLWFQQGKFIDADGKELTNSAENPAGNIVKISVKKNKISQPDRKLGFYTLNYQTGIDAFSDTIDTALEIKALIQSGAWFSVIDTETGEVKKDLKFLGRVKLVEYYKQNPDEYKKLLDYVNEEITKV